jgi:hypothetical protein
VKIGIPAVLITAAALVAVAVTACSSSSPVANGKSAHGASPGVTAGPKGVSVVLSSDPVCRQFQKDLKTWKTAIAEPGDASTVLVNTATRPAWVKFGRQLTQLSEEKTGGKHPRETARTLARAASLVTEQGTEPFRQFTGAQYQRTVTLLEGVTGDCATIS